ncbi:MAG: hypothetical protein GY870_18480 [archaeon]|nr:hypothetical protein [archaeon]
MRVKVKTPSRLHCSLIDLNGSLGRIDGGLGLTLREPNFEIEFLDNKSLLNGNKGEGEFKETIGKERVLQSKLGKIFLSVEDPNCNDTDFLLETIAELAISFIKSVYNEYKLYKSEKFPIGIKIYNHLQPHLGLGSKTQMSLAVGAGISKILDLDLDNFTLTDIVGRGGTSGIGYRSFDQGGFILDCGHKFGKNEEKESFLPSSASNSAKPARTILRYDFPEEWSILVILLNVKAGASNTEEINIFQEYTPIPLKEVREISHIILMQALPGLIERDLSTFGSAISKIQDIGFKKIEISLQHQRVKELMKFQRENGVKCVGMSSFGPAVFSIFESESAANEMLERIRKDFNDIGFNSYSTHINNKGADIQIFEE